jgi:hypothetical protein
MMLYCQQFELLLQNLTLYLRRCHQCLQSGYSCYAHSGGISPNAAGEANSDVVIASMTAVVFLSLSK